MNFKKINLLSLIPKNTRIILNKNFREFLFNKTFSIFSKTELTKKFGGSPKSYYEWAIGRKTPPFGIIVSLINLLGIKTDELFLNTNNLTAFFKKGSINVKNPSIHFDEEFAEWFGLVRGDGSISKKYIDCSNTKLSLIFQFTEFLEKRFGVKKSQFEITLRLPVEKSKKDFENVVDLIQKKGYSKIVITKREDVFKRRQLLYISRFNSKLTATIMSIIQENLNSLLKNSPNKVKSAFIRGYCAAEGSVGDRRVTIAQNNIKELRFIKKLLTSLEFKHVSGPERVGRGYRLAIYTKKELIKFYIEIGFGRNTIRNKKLKSLIDKYIYNEYKARKQRYDGFFKIIELNKKVTAPFIAKITENDYKYTSQLLNEMLKLRRIRVNRNSKPYHYFISDQNEN